MILKAKFLEWSAGLPVVMLNEATAKKLGVHSKDRVLIKTLYEPKKEVSTIVDLVKRIVKKNEIALSFELKKILGVIEGEKLEVKLCSHSKSIKYILKKLNGKKLSRDEIYTIIKEVVTNSLSDAEISLFVSAMYKQKMDLKETHYLINAILESGNVFKIDKKLVVDKHCIGGVPGNRTTPLVVSICAAAGLTFPKTSSRAITSAAGTADVIESVAKVDFPIKELKKILKKTNAFIVWGGGMGLVPADSKIIQIERILKIDPEAQLLASILSKKLAVSSKYILIDIPYGKGAKVSRTKAVRLKRRFELLGKDFHKKIKVVLTDGTKPIGNGIGPALEMMDVIKILDPEKKGPEDLEKKSLKLAGHILEMTGKAKRGQGYKKAKEILISGRAFEKFKEIVKAQKGNLNKLRIARYKKDIFAKKSGTIKEINNLAINSLARVAGCPVDKFSGIYLYHNVGDKIKKNEKLLTLYSESRERLNEAVKFYNEKKPVKVV